jgi:hypothetical protein
LTNNEIQQQLQLINHKSEQLLKFLEHNIDIDEDLEISEITQLQVDRSQLISMLFKQYSTVQIQNELQLINNMIDLDTRLQSKTEELKQALANKLIKIKKGKKSALTYKKY